MSVTPEKVREVIDLYVKAWATGDKALLLSIFAEDAVWADPYGTPEFKGHEGVAKFWDFSHQDSGRTLSPKVEEIRACGNIGILRFIMQVRVPEHNQGLDLSIIDMFTLDDSGKIKTANAFWDNSHVSAPPGMDLFIPNIDQAYET